MVRSYLLSWMLTRHTRNRLRYSHLHEVGLEEVDLDGREEAERELSTYLLEAEVPSGEGLGVEDGLWQYEGTGSISWWRI